LKDFFYYIVTFSYLLLPLSFFLSKSKKSEIVPVSLATYGILCCAFLLILDNYIPREFRKYFQISYTFFEYIIFTLLFWVNFKQKNARRPIFIASALFFTFLLIYSLTRKVKGIDTIPIGIETILILTYIIYFFYEFSKDTRSFYIYNHYCFWIAVGILIYLGGSFFFFILFDIIKNLLFALSIFIYHRYSLENAKRKTSSLPYLDMT